MESEYHIIQNTTASITQNSIITLMVSTYIIQAITRSITHKHITIADTESSMTGDQIINIMETQKCLRTIVDEHKSGWIAKMASPHDQSLIFLSSSRDEYLTEME